MSEENLLRRAQQLDPDALGQIFDTYYLPLYRYIFHRIRHQQTAEDLAALVFQRLLEAIRQRRSPERHLQAWLYRVARNLVIDDSRRHRVRDNVPLAESMAGNGQHPEDAVYLSILQQTVYAAVDTLTDKQRDVIILRYLESIPIADVAELLGLTEGAVKSLQHRALNALRREMHVILEEEN